jgi:hypothetical protein
MARYLKDIELKEYGTNDFSLRIRFGYTAKNKKDTGVLINGKSEQMLIDWAELVITDELCGFKVTSEKSMDEYKEVTHG